MSETETKHRGRVSILSNEVKVREMLEAISKNKSVQPSRYLKEKLVDEGFLEKQKIERDQRGRPPVVYSLTEKAKAVLGKTG